MLKAVIFDIDGVLIDSFESNLKFFRDIFRKAGYRPMTRHEYRHAFHLSLKDLLDSYIAKGNKRELSRVLKIGYGSLRQRETPKIPRGSIELIRQLAKRYRLALVTGRIEESVAEYLDHVKLHELFKVVVHYGHYKNPKPHPEPLLLALKRLHIQPRHAVYIGDAPTDVQAAKAAGVKVIQFNRKKAPGADAYANTFEGLGKALRKIDV